MRRTLMAIGAIVVAAMLSVTLTPGAAIADLAGMRMVGHLDSLSFVPGKGVVAVGWALDANHPSATDFQLQIRTSQTADTAYGPYLWDFTSPRPDVNAAYPGYGSNHGFVFEMGWYLPGTYHWCAEVTPKGSFSGAQNLDHWGYFEIGCATFVIPVRKLAGGIDSVAVGTPKHKLGISVAGWLTDSWAYPYYDESITFQVEHRSLDNKTALGGVTPGRVPVRPARHSQRPTRVRSAF
ncbi:hypothetical protein [Leifsonia poae]|uniref:hypothetical protein n=1 Tax=Leifsonia poae TaxID=110933 RepID=UPI003D66F9F3